MSGQEWEKKCVCVAVSWPGFLYLQVSSVQCSWLSLGKAWYGLGVPETLLHNPWAHLQVLGTEVEWVSPISQKSSFLFQAVSVKGRFTSPEMILRALVSCKWAAWEPKIHMAMYYCATCTVRWIQCEPRLKSPCSDCHHQHEAGRTHHVQDLSKCRCKSLSAGFLSV
jgi:hypothetical protein